MKVSYARCPHCERVQSFFPAAVRKNVTGQIRCVNPKCKKLFNPNHPDNQGGKKTGKTDIQRRSRDQEKRSAERNRARRVAGSGSSPRAKGDIKDRGTLHGECKYTTKGSYSLKLDDLMKLEREKEPGELALFEVEFQGVYPPQRYVVLSDDDFQHLRNLADGDTDD